MDFPSSVFSNSSQYNCASFATPPFYYTHSPPYADALSYSAGKTWLYAPTTPPDDAAFPMHHLRFPTPPITPPRGGAITLPVEQSSSTTTTTTTSTSTSTEQLQKRRPSVIMKVGQGNNSLQHVNNDASVGVVSLECTSNSASNSSSPSSDCYCDWIDCGSFFDSLESLATHVTQVHAIASPSDGLYYCCWRGCMRSERGFNARYKMLVHVRTHTKEKPHQCHLCEKCFSRAENLKIHIRSHSGEKPYVCTYDGCQKAYSNSSDRFKHTRTHSQEKPYMCKVAGCQKRYTDPSSLRKHVKTFKHTLQLVDEPKLCTIKPTTPTTIFEQHCELNSPVYLCAATPLSTDRHFYLRAGGVASTAVCHIMPNERSIDCYYAATNAGNYWSSLAETTMESKHSQDDDVDMRDMEVESPLDLRVHRS